MNKILHIDSNSLCFQYLGSEVDDFIMSEDSIIDPTGYSVGRKIFDENGEFFRRRGLGSNLEQL